MTAAHAPSKQARAAALYAARGWVLVPLHSAPGGRCSCGNATCSSPGKHPRTKSGLREATADPETVAGWWERWPDANLGCLPGPSGFVVLDLDGPEGAAAAQALGLLAEPTLEVETGRADGGRHRWYRHPGGHVGNAQLAPKIDVRGDAGYVLLPPSVHATGRTYRWHGQLADIASLPAEIVARIQGEPTAVVGTGPRPDQLPAWMIPWLEIAPGTRNTTMTRFVGSAYRHGHDAGTVLAMALGVNSRWPAPLESAEVEAIVKSIGAREATRPQRRTDTGTVLRVTDTDPDEPISLSALAHDQVQRAIEAGKVDYTDAPRWAWPDLNDLTGPMLPGDLVIVGALTGNGKTAFVMSQTKAWATAGLPVLYVPLELDPERVRRQWAAWECGLEWRSVARNDWAALPPGAQAKHDDALAATYRENRIHLPPDRRISLGALGAWTGQAVADAGAKVVVIDHFHRMDVGTMSANYRVQITDAARALKDLARSHQVAIVAMAQLNQDPSPLDRYYPPTLKRLKETAGLGEEADMVLMLSRRLRSQIDEETLRGIRSGHIEVRDHEERNIMMVTCRKHRLDDAARDRSVRLWVEGGRVVPMPWHPVRDPGWTP